jgi:putative PEP-CTERM system histidine kinase
MNMNFLLCLISAGLCTGLFFMVLLKNRRSFAHLTFACGLLVLAFEAGFTGFGLGDGWTVERMKWQGLRLGATALLPGIWFLFALTFGRAKHKEIVTKWLWAIFVSFAVPLFLVIVFRGSFFLEGNRFPPSSGWPLLLAWPGYLFYFFFLIWSVFILMNLERTLRGSAGRVRWQIKFLMVAVGGLFASRIYSGSQAVLFSSLTENLEMFNVVSVLIVDILILIAFSRLGILTIDIYPSQIFLYNSVIVLIVGIYLIAIGVLSKVLHHLDKIYNLPLEGLVIFLLLLGLTVALFSEEVRHQVRRFISRHFKRPRYDYRQNWRGFTQATAFLTETKNLCAVVAKIVAEMFDVSSATIWLADETGENLSYGGSTTFSEAQGRELGKEIASLIGGMRQEQEPLDFDMCGNIWAAALKRLNPDLFRRARIRYCVRLVAGDQFLGFMTLNDRIRRGLFSIEDFDLLKTVADQTAGNLLNLKLSADLHHARTAEAFQRMSAFFVHDLKNVASRLSLTIQNLPAHFDNPEFRSDAVRTISESLTKINGMCNRLSSLGEKLELQRRGSDLNELLEDTLFSLNGCLKTSPAQDLQPIPEVLVDPEQMQKVLINLLLNAHEATSEKGEVRITTRRQDGFAVLSVADSGCGISEEFIEKSLFRPFQTTKKKGMGIGLYQSKMIVEAHGGRIEVESKEGSGTTFRVMLPIESV